MDILLGDTLFKFEVNRLAFLISFMSSSQRNETHSFLDFAQLKKKKNHCHHCHSTQFVFLF